MLFVGATLLLCGLLSGGFAADLSCVDEDGNNVDWWYAMKLPKNSSQTDDDIVLGDAYLYLLSSQTDNKDWTHSTSGSNSASSLMGKTLAPIYASSASVLPKQSKKLGGFRRNKIFNRVMLRKRGKKLKGRSRLNQINKNPIRATNLAYVLYNDEKPDGSTTSSRGHTKGVLVLDETNGFWLVHSVPKYPPVSADGYSYPSSGLTYGQSYLCISLKTADADVIGKQFQYNIPYYYEVNMPSWSETALPQLYDAAVNDVHVTEEPYSNIETFKSAGGVSFTSFAKHTKYAKDLYGDLVAPNLEASLYVDTWNHGDDELPPVCGTYSVQNVNQVNVSAVGYAFSNYNDHSKWAVAPTTENGPWICVGDINRMASQENRAGGTVCQSNTDAWNTYVKSVGTVDPCT